MVVSVLVGAGLFFRSRWPLELLAVFLVGALATLVVPETGAPMIVASEIAVFTVARNRPRRVAALAALATAVVLFGVARTDSPGPMTEPRMLIVLVWTALACSLGVAVRTQRAYVEALAERARRADETREQEARARVAEERVRIARELHDVDLSVGDPRRAASGMVVRVHSPRASDLARLLLDDGVSVETSGEPGELRVTGLEAAIIGDRALAAGQPIRALIPTEISLEEAFM